MTFPQSAICAEGEAFGVFMTLMVMDGPVVRAALSEIARLTEQQAVAVGDETLCSAVSIGADIWPKLIGGDLPPGLVPFQPLADGPRQAPSTPADLFVHIHGSRQDSVFALACRVMLQFGNGVRLVEEIHGFRTRGSRDLTGFVDGTENPVGAERADVALVGDEAPVFQGGSYVSLQRYIHAMTAWEALPLAEQEANIGRTKADDQEIEEKPAFAHIARVVIEDEDGDELAIVRHSLPYGSSSEHGLYFVAYGRSPDPFRRMLERMIFADEQGHADGLLRYTRPVTGAAFFAPSRTFLEAL